MGFECYNGFNFNDTWYNIVDTPLWIRYIEGRVLNSDRNGEAG